MVHNTTGACPLSLCPLSLFPDSVLRELGLDGEYRPLEHPSFIEGRCAEVTIGTDLWARLGEILPQVLNNFGLAYPIVYCELRLARGF